MTFWFIVLGLPLLAYGVASLLFPERTAAFLRVFPRNVLAGRVLCAVGWAWTAWECHTIGIDVFDKFLKIFPGELVVLAVVLTVLTCLWMPNLLPIRGVCALFMLMPAEIFPVIRLCDTRWRLTLVVFAYICAIIGMFGMFYPWWIRKALEWRAASLVRVRAFGVPLAVLGALFIVLGAASAMGMIS